MLSDQARDPRRATRQAATGSREHTVRVLIADRDGLALSMMRGALAADEHIGLVLTARDGREAFELARYYRPDVAIVDAALPPGGAVKLVREVLSVAPESRVLTMAVDDNATALEALQAGAVGHIDKDVDLAPDELVRAVARAAAGEAVIPQALLLPLLERLRKIPQSGWRPVRSRLTPREWEILELLGESKSTDQIAECLVLSPGTVYSHIKRLMRKLGVHSRQDALTAAEHLRHEEALRTPSQPAHR